MALKPLNDTLVIKLHNDEWVGSEKSVNILKRGLIVAPNHNTMKKRSDLGTLISWGNRCKNKYSVGDKIRFRRPSVPVEVNGEEYRLIIEEQALTIEND